MLVSVIIPTFNGTEKLIRALDSLSEQSLDSDVFEVVVVDDGSSEDIALVCSKPYPFCLHYLRQTNQGATIARNNGVIRSNGDILVFIDDDVTISFSTLEILARACMQDSQVIVMGKIITRCPIEDGIFTKIAVSQENELVESIKSDGYVHFSFCNTQLLALKRQDFFDLGRFQDHTGGWPNWDDVDFGYRAYMKNYRLLRCANAIGEHWDYSKKSLYDTCHRWYQASKSASRLFLHYPDLKYYLPMFDDKTPINRYDRPSIVIRKIIRIFASSILFTAYMERTVSLLERYDSSHFMLKMFYRWIIGGYIFRGYRQGLKELSTYGLDKGD